MHVCSKSDMRVHVPIQETGQASNLVPHLSKPVISGVVALNKADGSSIN